MSSSALSETTLVLKLGAAQAEKNASWATFKDKNNNTLCIKEKYSGVASLPR